MKKLQHTLSLACLIFFGLKMTAQAPFRFGADLSYVNEMEDCGVVYRENGLAKDPYQMFADHKCNLVRLRLWHTPAWQDTLNAGHRYSNLSDVRKSILRAKAAGMQVLLDFHLSDTWADPQHQVVPAAWLPVVDNLPVLKDSVYNYISHTLLSLNADGLLPDLVQIGNETNKGILQSPAQDAAGWALDWNRNSQLFKRGIEAVRAVETATGKTIRVALHIAGPADAGWLMQGFWSNGVTDFDIIGLSYYWAWHQPTDIADAGNIVAQLRQTYPGKEVMIFETGYLWTTANNDNANNIINAVHPAYAPASPDNQRLWLEAMTQEVISRGAAGVLYWEPAWQSSPCYTPWGQGSHQEHATFFDFENNLLPTGGMLWMEHEYDLTSAAGEVEDGAASQWSIKVLPDSNANSLRVRLEGFPPKQDVTLRLFSANGMVRAAHTLPAQSEISLSKPALAPGVYFLAVFQKDGKGKVEKLWLNE